jgi:hypothetical protein
MLSSHRHSVGLSLVVLALGSGCSGGVAADPTADAGAADAQVDAAGATTTTTHSKSPQPAPTASSQGGGGSAPAPEPQPDPPPDTQDAGAPAPSPPPVPTCAFADTKFGPACRCTFDADGSSYVIACDTMACVCDLNQGASLNVVSDTFESSCTVSASGDWPGSIGCGYPTK